MLVNILEDVRMEHEPELIRLPSSSACRAHAHADVCILAMADDTQAGCEMQYGTQARQVKQASEGRRAGRLSREAHKSPHAGATKAWIYLDRRRKAHSSMLLQVQVEV